jgi:hypothetical protein
MPVIVKDSEGGTFTPHPEGQYAAVCIDVHDLGVIETKWGNKHKIDIYFWCGRRKEDETGEPASYEDGTPIYLTVRERFTATLNEKGNLRPFLERWRGRKFTTDELKGFDLEQLIGAPAFLQISHNEWDGKVFANIDTIMKLPKGEDKLAVPEDYVRFADRKDTDASEPEPAGVGAGPDEEDDGLPF